MFQTFHYFLYWTCRVTTSQGVFQWSADCKVNFGGCSSNEVDGWMDGWRHRKHQPEPDQHKYLRTAVLWASVEKKKKWNVTVFCFLELELETTLPHTAGTLQIFKCPFGVSHVCCVKRLTSWYTYICQFAIATIWKINAPQLTTSCTQRWYTCTSYLLEWARLMLCSLPHPAANADTPTSVTYNRK